VVRTGRASRSYVCSVHCSSGWDLEVAGKGVWLAGCPTLHQCGHTLLRQLPRAAAGSCLELQIHHRALPHTPFPPFNARTQLCACTSSQPPLRPTWGCTAASACVAPAAPQWVLTSCLPQPPAGARRSWGARNPPLSRASLS